ncbi:hypothetical protein RHMOL_Rhmol08G0220000 [Rhododendron molle]|uniref:Uncharacterized protein n=1 Tax=Rhododendron molle TaxID=49168 RepID=A0ACC0MSD1_RHOML|nr:hypothetical protein RHMOL_Rhmol08G0220000 [Rhododendron molle]
MAFYAGIEAEFWFEWVPRARVKVCLPIIERTPNNGTNGRYDSSWSRVAEYSGIPYHRQAGQDCQNTTARLNRIYIQEIDNETIYFENLTNIFQAWLASLINI